MKVYIADTNNHVIRVCNYEEGIVRTPSFSEVPEGGAQESERTLMQDDGSLALNLRCVGDKCLPKDD